MAAPPRLLLTDLLLTIVPLVAIVAQLLLHVVALHAHVSPGPRTFLQISGDVRQILLTPAPTWMLVGLPVFLVTYIVVLLRRGPPVDAMVGYALLLAGACGALVDRILLLVFHSEVHLLIPFISVLVDLPVIVFIVGTVVVVFSLLRRARCVWSGLRSLSDHVRTFGFRSLLPVLRR